MNDRELLEMAAKAAGINVIRSRLEDPMSNDLLVKQSGRNPFQAVGSWNPLADDGDALRLAVKLGISMQHSATIDTHEPNIETFDSKDRFGGWFEEVKGGDPFAAARRAIVRAAAEIGRQMQEGGAA